MTSLTSIQRRSVEVARLTDYFAGLPDGDDVSWLRVEHETGIRMDARGRDWVRRALWRSHRPYVALRGVGVRLSAPDNAIEIMGGRFVRIDNAVRRSDTIRERLQDRHLDQMDPAARERMLTWAGFFGAVRAFAAETKQRLLG